MSNRGIEDPDTRTVPLEDDDGNEVVIQQQNVGAGNEVGGGEFPDPDTPPRDPGEAAAEQDELDAQVDEERARRPR